MTRKKQQMRGTGTTANTRLDESEEDTNQATATSEASKRIGGMVQTHDMSAVPTQPPSRSMGDMAMDTETMDGTSTEDMAKETATRKDTGEDKNQAPPTWIERKMTHMMRPQRKVNHI